MARTKAQPAIKTVWDECQNRNRCRYGLAGVLVRVGGVEDMVRSTTWGRTGLLVTLADGAVARAEDCELLTPWPIACCRPKVRHPLNAITPETRFRILARDGAACTQCGSRDVLQIDHRFPVSKGGTDHDRNLTVLCKRCNLKKAARAEED